MLAYKAFNKDLTCTMGKGKYQYEEGKWHEEPHANCVRNGYHCAENPLDCLTYYGDWDASVYYLVEAEGDIDEDGGDSKISSTRIRLIQKLNMFDFVSAALEYICRHPERKISERSGMITVCRDCGKARKGGAVIVHGEHPVASGPAGSILALVKRHPDGGIASVCIRNVDGERCKADTKYQI